MVYKIDKLFVAKKCYEAHELEVLQRYREHKYCVWSQICYKKDKQVVTQQGYKLDIVQNRV